MSTIKANTLTVKCGSTLTLGESGKTVAIASGASTTGMGREGAVNWQTGSIKTATFTAVSGEGYFCNTTGGTFTVNLPAGSAGAIISVSDYARKFATNKLTISPNGSEKIGGVAEDASLETIGQSATFVYVDSTNGWINVQETSNSVTGAPPFIVATGGTISNTPTCRIHTFTSPGNFVVCNVSSTPANNAVAYMVIAGGGGGGGGGSGGDSGGGGGAGGFREGRTAPITPYTASPLAVTTGITVTAQTYPIVVGAGGAGGSPPGNGAQGSTSSGLSISSAGGGPGQGNTPGGAGSGGSGGGGRGGGGIPAAGGSGNTPPVSPPQGQNGGSGGSPAGPNPQSPDNAGGGGGGAGGAGDGAGPGDDGGDGGAGVTSSINNSPVARAGGGSSSGFPNGSASAGGGTGTALPSSSAGGAGTVNTGGGGGGGHTGGAGGSGLVIIRYKIA